MHIEQPSQSLIDIVQEFLEVIGWDFYRDTQDHIHFDCVGNWNTYRFVVAAKSAPAEAFICCQLPFVIPKTYGQNKKVLSVSKATCLLRELIELNHAELPLGTFYSTLGVERTITVDWFYRLQINDEIDLQLLQDTLNRALDEIDDFYPALALVLTGEVTAQEALDDAIPEVYGTA